MLLQSLLRPVLTPIMRGIFDPAQSVSAAWSPLSLWPDGIASPGMWMSPRTLTSEWQDYTGTTPVATPGTVADTSNPVGLALDIRAGATVLTDPGNHMLQSTSAARPLLSALVNRLQSTESLAGLTITGGNIAAASMTGWPNGITTGVEFTGAGLSYAFTGAGGEALASTLQNMSFFVEMDDGLAPNCTSASSPSNDFDVVLAGDTVSGPTLTVEAIGSGVYRISGALTTGVGALGNNGVMKEAGNTARTFKASGYQLTVGADLKPYQRVNTASDYDASAAPLYWKFDGVDDGMATAAFSTGTLINGMDCQIPVRLDSAAATYLISDTGSRGFFEWASGDTSRPDVGAGTPTYLVDGVAVTATKGALFTALTAGDWHILEARGLDLSTWTALEVSSLVSYRLNGPRGDILLYPSTASTADKDAARQWLADYYGVTLP